MMDIEKAMTQQRFDEVLLLARREALAATARHLWTQRRCKEAAECEAELRSVTHQILAQGVA